MWTYRLCHQNYNYIKKVPWQKKRQSLHFVLCREHKPGQWIRDVCVMLPHSRTISQFMACARTVGSLDKQLFRAQGNLIYITFCAISHYDVVWRYFQPFVKITWMIYFIRFHHLWLSAAVTWSATTGFCTKNILPFETINEGKQNSVEYASFLFVFIIVQLDIMTWLCIFQQKSLGMLVTVKTPLPQICVKTHNQSFWCYSFICHYWQQCCGW